MQIRAGPESTEIISRTEESKMSKVFVFLADGFEEIEGLTVVDILRRAQIETETVSVTGKKEVHGSHGITVFADKLFEEISGEDAALLVLPGGMPGTLHLGAHQGLAELLKKAVSDGKKVAAICAAPSVLGELGLLKGQRAVCYPGFEEKLLGAETGTEPVAVSGNITTSRGMGTAIPFALSLAAQLKDQKTADAIGEGIIWDVH